MPHAFVFLSGMAGSLVEPRPPTLASIFGPRSDPEHGFHWKQSSFWKDVKIGQTEALLQWWATRLNVIYRHMLNPARFQNEDGWFEPERQTAWYLTIERMLADSLAISSVPQHSPLIRQQFAFDLLDKLETLLGFNETGSPLYFQKLLDRKLMVPRLARAWSRLPIQAQHRFNAQTEHLYDAIYKDARDHTYAHRLTTKGVKITDDSGRLLGLPIYARFGNERLAKIFRRRYKGGPEPSMRNLAPGTEVVARRKGSSEEDLVDFGSDTTLCGEILDENWEIYRWPEGDEMDDICEACLEVSMNRS